MVYLEKLKKIKKCIKFSVCVTTTKGMPFWFSWIELIHGIHKVNDLFHFSQQGAVLNFLLLIKGLIHFASKSSDNR